MAKDPAFLFYPNDYLGGTLGMTFEEKGAYIELLMLQFNRGHMTSHMIGQVVGHLWDKIKDKFVQDENGLWYNERLDLEKEKRLRFTESRRNNKNGTNQYTKKSGHMTYHMENENRNEDIELRTKKPKTKIPSLDEFLDYCRTIDGIRYPDLQFHLKAKYEAWVGDGWKDGNGNQIKNWKTKIKNTIPFLKPIYGTEKLGTSAARIQAAADF